MKTLICPNKACAVPHYKPNPYFVCPSCAVILVLEKGALRIMRKSDRKKIKVAHMVELKAEQNKLMSNGIN